MLVRFTKNTAEAKADALTCVRTDGSSTTGPMARRGSLPHECFRFVIEATLEWHDAFFGQVARGGSIGEVAARLNGNSGAWSRNVQALQSESLAECLKAEPWDAPADPAAFAENLVRACRRRGVTPPDITAAELEPIRRAVREFGVAWRSVAPGGSLERTF